METANRFSSRVENYVKYRPGYPPEIVDFISRECGLTPESIVADVGSGTGKFSELLLKNGNKVFGVEPGDEMRKKGEALLASYPNFVSIKGSAEQTTLESSSVDFVTAAQAFHWFDRDKTRAEFSRILKPGGWAILIWNERRLRPTQFLVDYEDLLLEFGTDYQRVRHENAAGSIPDFFHPSTFHTQNFDNYQSVNFEGLRGRLESSSYTPEPGHDSYESMIKGLQRIFDEHQVEGKVKVEYDTTVFYGQL